MNHTYKLSFALLLLQALAPAAVLLDQPLTGGNVRASNTINGSQGFQTWERFSLSQDVFVSRISWVGAFADYANTANNPVPADGDSWQFEFAGDSANAPGASTYSANLAFATVSQSYLGLGTVAGQPATLYRLTADLLSPMFIGAGQTMWLSIFSINDSLVPTHGWMPGSGGDGVAKQFLFSDDSLVGTYGDRALTLEGEAVPEPGTYALVGAGCLLLGIFRRNR